MVFVFQEPIVILESNLVSSASAWDLDYLAARMPGKYTVIVSDDHNFMYYDEKKLEAYPDFIPSTRRVQMTMPDFVAKIRSSKENDERIYLQQALDNSIGLSIIQDFARFNWTWIKEKQKKNNWGPLTSNLLLISMEGQFRTTVFIFPDGAFTAAVRCVLQAMLLLVITMNNKISMPKSRAINGSYCFDLRNSSAYTRIQYIILMTVRVK